LGSFVIAVSLGWLQAAVEWLDKQGGFTQGVIVAAVLAVASGAGALLTTGFSKLASGVKARRRNARDALAEAAADFQRGPSDPGIFDHGVRRVESFNAIGKGIVAALPLMTTLSEKVLFGDTVKSLATLEDATPRAKIARNLARDIHPTIRDLERVAEGMEPKAAELITSYRVLFHAIEITDEGLRGLQDMRDVFVTGAPKFEQVARTCALLRRQLEVVEGKQADLTRMIARARVSLHAIESVASTVASFASIEMPQAVAGLSEKVIRPDRSQGSRH
jgi:hypothetical protein